MPQITLSTERYVSLLEAERKLHDILQEYDKAEACGIDCSQLRAIRDQYMEQIAGLKQHYAPQNKNRFPTQD